MAEDRFDFTGTVMAALDGPELTREDEQRISLPAVGAVCLFARNYESRSQLARYVAAIRRSAGKPLLIAVDQEGGRVQRFKGAGFTDLPAQRKLGEIYAEDPGGALFAAVERGAAIAREVAAVDIDLSFVPVLDIDYGRNRMIGSRCFAGNAQAVTALALAFCQGLGEQGMHAVGKHFPGHGWAVADTHYHAAIDERPLEEIERSDLLPYRELISRGMLGGVMLAHVRHQAIADEPATYSAKAVELLRRDLGFRGRVMTDDLVMQGAGSEPLGERIKAAAAAGVELFLPVGGEPVLNDSEIAGLPASGNRISPWQSLLRKA